MQLNADVNMFQRKFTNEVRRCNEMERILNYIETQITSAGFKITDTGENPEAPQPRELTDLEVTTVHMTVSVSLYSHGSDCVV